MQIAMIYYNFLHADGETRVIGGVETYLWNLSRLIAERGDKPILFQPAAQSFDKQIEHLKVIGVTRNRMRLRKHVRRDLYDCAMSCLKREGGVIVFGADNASVRTNFPRSLSIQHGIGWDLPAHLLHPTRFLGTPLVTDVLYKRYLNYRAKLYFCNTPNRVCVDYNFLNWYRTQVADDTNGKTWVIPNFVDTPTGYLPDLERHARAPVKILFARRFVEMRGTRLMVEAAKQLLPTFPGLEVCFAGEGPDERIIADAFPNEPRVTICKYLPDESLAVHSGYHIAVVPSLGSEGTSLSLAEAMAAGCAVVATNVGGMTNMIIDGYNGRFIDPNSASLVAVLAELVRDSELRRRLAKCASETARESFSLKKWNDRWSGVLDHIQSIPL